MAKYQALVKRLDGSIYKAGDIVKIAKSGHPFGSAELAACDVVELESEDFHDIWNLEASLDQDVMEAIPAGVTMNIGALITNARMVQRPILELSRYRIDESGKVMDKKYD